MACERPQNLAASEQAIGQAAGLTVKLELALAPAAEAVTPSRRRFLRANKGPKTADQPMVRQASEVFKAKCPGRSGRKSIVRHKIRSQAENKQISRGGSTGNISRLVYGCSKD